MNKFNIADLKNLITFYDCCTVINSLYSDSLYKEQNEYNIYYSFDHHTDYRQHKPKLYWYKESLSGFCFSCGTPYCDIFALVMKVKNISFPESINYVMQTLGITENKIKSTPRKFDWHGELNKYINNTKSESDRIIDEDVLNFYPHIWHEDWLDFGISEKTLDKYDIRWYDYGNQIVIPYRNECGQLIGIRVRNMNPESERKYDALKSLDGTDWKFTANSHFYGELFNSMEIQRTKTAWLVEAEKSVMKFDTWFGDKNVSLALCGSNLTDGHVKKLIKWNVKHIVIMLDSDFENVDDEHFDKFEKNVLKIADRLKNYVDKIEVVYNNIGLENWYKCAPCDGTKEQFEELYKNREVIE